jgi:hypothetical protein
MASGDARNRYGSTLPDVQTRAQLSSSIRPSFDSCKPLPILRSAFAAQQRCRQWQRQGPMRLQKQADPLNQA